MSNQKKILISMSEALIESLDKVADSEYRTRSECVREAVRLYINTSIARKKALDSAHNTTVFDQEIMALDEMKIK